MAERESQPAALCAHADRCGGCPTIAIPYTEQLAAKRARVVTALTRFTSLNLSFTDEVLPASPIVGYRVRAKLIVGPDGSIGLFAKGGGHQVVDIPDCLVLTPLLKRLVGTLRDRIRSEKALAPFDPTERTGTLRAIDIREVIDGGKHSALVTLVVHAPNTFDVASLRDFATALRRDEPDIIGVAVSNHDGENPQVLGTRTELLDGVATARDRIGATTHLATFGSFVQAHREQAARVHTMLAEGLGIARARAEGRTVQVLDLYGGSGAMSLALATQGCSVTLVEAFGPAADHAKRAAEEQRLASLDVIHMDVTQALRRLSEKKPRFDAVVINPPRRGISPYARELAARLEAARIAYVSCDPDTLARDLDHFIRLGYAPVTTRPLDMIPLTDEVETVVMLARSPVPQPRVLWEDETVIMVDKEAHEPTVPQAEYASSTLGRVRALRNAASATPVHRLDIGTTGVVLFARTPEHLAAWEQALQQSRKIYLAAAKGTTPTKGTINRTLREVQGDSAEVHEARTRYRRLAVAGGHSVLRVVPEQGRTHQIRRHLAAIGHPILGDDRYGHAPTNRFFEERHGLDRTFLHCVRLEIEHPITGAKLVIEAPMPGDLDLVLSRAGGANTLRFLESKHALGTGGVSSVPPPPDSEQGPSLDVFTSPVSERPPIATDDD